MRELRAQENGCGSGRNVGHHRTQNLYFGSIIVFTGFYTFFAAALSPFVFSVVGLFQMKFLLKILPASALLEGDQKEDDLALGSVR